MRVAVASRYGLPGSSRVTQALASTSSTSVGFPVFANQLRGGDPAEIDGLDFIQQPLHLAAGLAVGSLDLPLGHPLQEAAAGLASGRDMGVEALQQVIGD